MTVGESIVDWLEKFDGANFTQISTDFIDADISSYSIFKSPNETIKEYINGENEVTAYYQIFARQSTQKDSERIGNQQLLYNLENWIEEKEYDEDYPDLSQVGNLTCVEIGVANSATITSQEDDNAIYQVTIKITYLKERN